MDLQDMFVSGFQTWSASFKQGTARTSELAVRHGGLQASTDSTAASCSLRLCLVLSQDTGRGKSLAPQRRNRPKDVLLRYVDHTQHHTLFGLKGHSGCSRVPSSIETHYAGKPGPWMSLVSGARLVRTITSPGI